MNQNQIDATKGSLLKWAVILIVAFGGTVAWFGIYLLLIFAGPLIAIFGNPPEYVDNAITAFWILSWLLFLPLTLRAVWRSFNDQDL